MRLLFAGNWCGVIADQRGTGTDVLQTSDGPDHDEAVACARQPNTPPNIMLDAAGREKRSHHVNMWYNGAMAQWNSSGGRKDDTWRPCDCSCCGRQEHDPVTTATEFERKTTLAIDGPGIGRTSIHAGMRFARRQENKRMSNE